MLVIWLLRFGFIVSLAFRPVKRRDSVFWKRSARQRAPGTPPTWTSSASSPTDVTTTKWTLHPVRLRDWLASRTGLRRRPSSTSSHDRPCYTAHRSVMLRREPCAFDIGKRIARERSSDCSLARAQHVYQPRAGGHRMLADVRDGADRMPRGIAEDCAIGTDRVASRCRPARRQPVLNGCSSLRCVKDNSATQCIAWGGYRSQPCENGPIERSQLLITQAPREAETTESFRWNQLK